MMKMRLLPCLMILMQAVSCTEVSLYEGTDYTDRAKVKFAYDWVSNMPNDGFDHDVPDSMYVIAKRIVGAWKCGVKVNSTDGAGYYLTNAPELEEPEVIDEETDSIPGDNDEIDVEPTPETPTADSTAVDSTAIEAEPVAAARAHSRGYVRTRAEGGQPGVDEPTDVFEIIPGFYKFVTFNCDTTEYIYQDIKEYLLAEENKTTLQELCMEYKRYAYSDPHLRGTVRNWKDFNLYGDGKNYIQPDITPIYYDSISNERIVRGDQPTLTFAPGLLTQNIDIRFKIRKKVDVVPIIIDSVYADISGIPYRVNLSNDYIDIKQTCKMMFQNYMEDANGNRITDTGTNTELYCHGNIDVLSVVNAHDSTTTKGPGIMQIMVFIRGYQPIRGMINLYHCIRRANLINDVGDGVWARKRKNHGVLEIDSDLLIDEKLLISDDGDGGLDRWIPMGDEDIVIDT